MNPNQALWEKGDFSRLAAFLRTSGEALVKSLGVEPGQRVLDLACGDGTTALPLAALGAEVTGIDIARNLVAAGNRRAQAAGLKSVRFQAGDACDLGDVPDDSFDLTISIFGAMFAPKPVQVAREMVRVTKPGGRIVMGNWIPGDPTFVSQLLKISMAFVPPPPPGFISPMTWGVEAHVIERFGEAGVPAANIGCERKTFHLMSADQSPEDFITLSRDYYGPTMNAYEAARQSGREAELHRQLVALAQAQNIAAGAGTDIPATYLEVTVRI